MESAATGQLQSLLSTRDLPVSGSGEHRNTIVFVGY